jgi:uncharacterized protein YjbI with pentapeptide repeats
MADANHLQTLEQGVKAWNEWRKRTPEITPDLSKADLYRQRLNEIDFSDTVLTKANLRGAVLTNGSLERANLRECNLHGAILCGVKMKMADLSEATLIETNFNQADMRGADLSNTFLYETNFANTKLSGVRGLDSCRHLRPSIIDHRTIAKSDNLPLAFLRGCGLPDIMIENIAAFKGDPIQFHSCFISYSSNDEEFANRLHADLQDHSVRCWFAPEDMKIGDPLRTAIDRAIHVHDRLLLILSEASVQSQWVEHEVENALGRERSERRTVLFPIRIDDMVFRIEAGWASYIRNTRNVGNFCEWQTHVAYKAAFKRLLRALKVH